MKYIQYIPTKYIYINEHIIYIFICSSTLSSVYCMEKELCPNVRLCRNSLGGGPPGPALRTEGELLSLP